MTEREYYDKLADFHHRNLKRALIPKEEFSSKEFFDFVREQNDFILEYQRQKQEEKELETKLTDYVSSILEDVLSGFDGKGQSRTKQMELKIDL